MITFKVDQRQLADLKGRLNSRVFRKAIDVALFNIGEEVSKDAKDAAPYKSGTLRRSIKSEVGNMFVEIGTDLVYAPIHEFGGTIRAKNKPFLAWKTGNGFAFARSVRIPKRPYLMPAYEKMAKGRAIDIITKEITNSTW